MSKLSNPKLNKQVVTKNTYKTLTIEQLENKERWLNNEIAALQLTLAKTKNELFNRKQFRET